MLLTIDVGNTQIEVGVFKEDKLLRSWRIATGGSRTEDEFMIFLNNFLEQAGISISELQGVVLSSVVPNATFILEKMCYKYLNLTPLVVDYSKKLGIKIRYSDPSAVGADRLCNVVAAFERYRQGVIVIDFGTATTFDIVNSRAEYLGGIIAPGVETTAWALYHRAARLPKIALDFPPSAIGRDTEQSMQAGIMLGTVKMIDGLIKEIVKELGENPRVIATGGLAKLIQPRTDSIEACVQHLVLEGLYLIYKLNT